MLLPLISLDIVQFAYLHLQLLHLLKDLVTIVLHRRYLFVGAVEALLQNLFHLVLTIYLF